MKFPYLKKYNVCNGPQKGFGEEALMGIKLCSIKELLFTLAAWTTLVGIPLSKSCQRLRIQILNWDLLFS